MEANLSSFNLNLLTMSFPDLCIHILGGTENEEIMCISWTIMSYHIFDKACPFLREPVLYSVCAFG